MVVHERLVPDGGAQLDQVQEPITDAYDGVLLAQFQKRPRPATVLGRNSAPTADAHRVPSSGLQRPNLLDPDVMLPAVGEVVLIQEALADTQPELAEPHPARIAAATFPVLPPLDDKAMEVLIAPAKAVCKVACRSAMVLPRTSRRRQISGLTPRRTTRSW